MSSANTLTGRKGRFSVGTHLIARCKKWDVANVLASKSEWGDSDSAGYTNRAPGRRDATFDTEGVYDSAAVVLNLFAAGDNAATVLYLDALVTASLYWDFPRSQCEDFKLSVDIDSEQVIGWTSSWGADGIFYRPFEAGATAHAALPAL